MSVCVISKLPCSGIHVLWRCSVSSELVRALVSHNLYYWNVWCRLYRGGELCSRNSHTPSSRSSGWRLKPINDRAITLVAPNHNWQLLSLNGERRSHRWVKQGFWWTAHWAVLWLLFVPRAVGCNRKTDTCGQRNICTCSSDVWLLTQWSWPSKYGQHSSMFSKSNPAYWGPNASSS